MKSLRPAPTVVRSLVVVAYPLDVGLVLGRVGPYAGDHGWRRLRPVRQGGLIRADAVAGAVDRIHQRQQPDGPKGGSDGHQVWIRASDLRPPKERG